MAADQTRAQLAEEAKLWIAQVVIAAHRRSPAQTKVAVEALEAFIDRLAAEQAGAQAQGWQPPQGWKLVPIEPTKAMLDAGYDAENNDGKMMLRPAWRYMLDAAPPIRTPSTAGGGVGEAL